ncbi:hypothetical protein ANCCEY_10534 [Ancylostoma ceylanicum]|uniref:Uncharacterized protein n=2 Tax=Ancylostoma ceylanicum TaxID=53326 RepID=A0A0D6LE84_9BILA|nr:hypothetical protein ANCCEY_10534 [Ancylostoma ceylanicum]EYC26429.1 hypothetical protein Y032_0010g1151 [Ancylostoma ceylanicum]
MRHAIDLHSFEHYMTLVFEGPDRSLGHHKMQPLLKNTIDDDRREFFEIMSDLRIWMNEKMEELGTRAQEHGIEVVFRVLQI